MLYEAYLAWCSVGICTKAASQVIVRWWGSPCFLNDSRSSYPFVLNSQEEKPKEKEEKEKQAAGSRAANMWL